jgi:hypothetical protein
MGLIMRFRTIIQLTLTLLLGAGTSVYASNAVFKQVGKVIAIGDLHGDYEQYITLMKDNRLINDELQWVGGDVHLVQLGDVTDRGPDSLKIIRHLMKMEKAAKRSGGKVHVLIGNHEAMNVQTDLRYVHPGEYSVLVTKKSEKMQGRYVDAVLRAMIKGKPELANQEADLRLRLMKRYPRGYVEHRMLWEPGKELAKWYARHNAVVQVNDALYLHGGIDPHVEELPSLKEINRRVQGELKPNARVEVTINERGPLWYRGLAAHSAETELGPLNRMLEHYGVERIVIAHTPTKGMVLPRFGGKVIMADVGLARHYGSGHANVVMEQGKVFTMHRGELIEVPTNDDLDAYIQKVVSLEPEGSRLHRWALKSIADSSDD